MEKGRFGIRMCFYTALAFILAYLGYSTVLFLIAAVVIFLEKNEWAGRQVIQAICLCFVSTLVHTLVNIFDPISRIPMLGMMWNVGTDLVDSLMSIVVLVLCAVGFLNNIKGREANIIGASKLADWAYGIARPDGKDQSGKA